MHLLRGASFSSPGCSRTVSEMIDSFDSNNCGSEWNHINSFFKEVPAYLRTVLFLQFDALTLRRLFKVLENLCIYLLCVFFFFAVSFGAIRGKTHDPLWCEVRTLGIYIWSRFWTKHKTNRVRDKKYRISNSNDLGVDGEAKLFETRQLET